MFKEERDGVSSHSPSSFCSDLLALITLSISLQLK